MTEHDAPAAPVYPRAVNHIGVGVADIERAIRWYQEVLGFTLLRAPKMVRGDDPDADVRDVLGPDCNAMLLAHMVSVNGVGIELFQLLDPPHERREPSLEYWKSGFFHICVTDPDIEGLAKRIASSGGRQRSKIWRNDPTTDEYRLCYCEDPFGNTTDEYRLCYCEDPFGNIIEIYTHNYETLYGGMKPGRQKAK